MSHTHRTSRRAMLGYGKALLALPLAAIPLAACAPQSSSTSQPSAAATAATGRREKFVIAVQPTNTPEKLEADAKSLERFLADQMNADVDIIFPTSYAGVIESLRFGHAQAAFMAAWPLALAKKVAGADTVLAEVREVVIDDQMTAKPFYYSYFVVPKGSPVQRMEDLRGKRVAFPSQLSTSGYVAPVARMVELGLIPAPAQGREANPRTFFGEVLFAGGYGQGWEALKAGQVDATVIAGDVAERLYREVIDGTRQIEKQGPIPSHGVAVARQLSPEKRTQLIDALMKLNDPQHRPLMRQFISAIFVSFAPTTTEEHLKTLQTYLQETGFQYTESLR